MSNNKYLASFALTPNGQAKVKIPDRMAAARCILFLEKFLWNPRNSKIRI